MFYADIVKVFDSVPHHKLIPKLADFGFDFSYLDSSRVTYVDVVNEIALFLSFPMWLLFPMEFPKEVFLPVVVFGLHKRSSC